MLLPLFLFAACGSIEKRCAQEAHEVSPYDPGDYFRSCVETKRQALRTLSHAWDGYNRNSTNCTSQVQGNTVYTNCR
jgi:hypothetical protein